MLRLLSGALTLTTALLLAGCDDDKKEYPRVNIGEDTAQIAGKYSGYATYGLDVIEVFGLVLETGEVFLVYGADLLIEGGLAGKLKAKSGVLSASNLVDYSWNGLPAVPVTLADGRYSIESKLQGSLVYDADNQNSAQFELLYQLNSNAVPTVASIAGDWLVGDSDGGNGEMNISSGGVISGTGEEGCEFLGQLTPVKAAFTMNLTMGADCANAGTYTGIVDFSDEALSIIALNSSEQMAFLAFAERDVEL